MNEKAALTAGCTVYVLRPECEDTPVLEGTVESVHEDCVTVDCEHIGAVDVGRDDLFADRAFAEAALACRRADAGTNIKLVFFKENGKYYTEDSAYIPDKSMQVFQIVDWLKANAKACRGMYLAAMLDELDHGCPVMIPAGERR